MLPERLGNARSDFKDRRMAARLQIMGAHIIARARHSQAPQTIELLDVAIHASGSVVKQSATDQGFRDGKGQPHALEVLKPASSPPARSSVSCYRPDSQPDLRDCPHHRRHQPPVGDRRPVNPILVHTVPCATHPP